MHVAVSAAYISLRLFDPDLMELRGDSSDRCEIRTGLKEACRYLDSAELPSQAVLRHQQRFCHCILQETRPIWLPN